MTSPKTIGRKAPPRSTDFEFTWVTRDLGPQWELWRSYAADWMGRHHRNMDGRLFSLRAFLEAYLHDQGLPSDPRWLLDRANAVPDFYETACPASYKGTSYARQVHDFIQWVLDRHFSEPDDHGRPVVLPGFHNPIVVHSSGEVTRLSESVRAPLPYRFIRELRELLAPGRSFREWAWAQAGTPYLRLSQGDWFDVDASAIDPDDPDCVWREIRTTRAGTAIPVTQIWSPARAVALLIKLMLPLRTFQLVMLDSGEADTWRYTSGGWVPNPGALAEGTARRPVSRGIFRRVEDRELGEMRTALYINTNKTADIGKDGEQLGYVIPWQHDEVLYWLEKLRNWQSRYNPIARPISWTELEFRHLGNAKSQRQLARHPPACFMFRHAAGQGGDRERPFTGIFLDRLWYELLDELQRLCARRQDVLADGRPLQFVEPFARSNHGIKTLFPLHCLRVSLLTCLALDTDVPLAVLSKLVAGHSRLIMTLYYTKPGIVRTTEALNAAAQKLDATAAEGLQRFLQEASYEQLRAGVVSNNEDGLLAAIAARPEDRNAAGWMPRHHGLCLVGGNTSPDEAHRRMGGCFNGGELVVPYSQGNMNVYAPVPGGAGNCVRCRWFVTEPHYLDALRAHFNNLSYHLAEAARVAHAHEDALEAIKQRRVQAEEADLPFAEQATYLRAERVWEAAITKVDHLANDLTATFRLIQRCHALLERQRSVGSPRQLVAVGGLHDVRVAMEETSSELLQLAGVCLDAELYTDESPGEAVVRRSQLLDSALYREGLAPVFMTLAREEQLTLGNRFLEHLAAQVEPDEPALGLRRIVGVLDAGGRLADLGLHDGAAEIVKALSVGTPVLRDLVISTDLERLQ